MNEPSGTAVTRGVAGVPPGVDMYPPVPDPEDTAYPEWLRDALEPTPPYDEPGTEPVPDEPRPEDPGPGRTHRHGSGDGPHSGEARSEDVRGPAARDEEAEADRGGAQRTGVANGRLLYRGLQVSVSDSQRLRCRVALKGLNGDFFGTAEGRNVPALRARIAAQATLDALGRGHGRDGELALEDADVVQAIGTEVVVVGVHAIRGRRTATLVGACPVDDSVEHAAVLATLQATNRWLAEPRTDDGGGGAGRGGGPDEGRAGGPAWPGPLTWPQDRA